jgi:excisionase family DNA binding protein
VTVTQLPRWRTVPEAAKAAGVSEWTIRKEIAEGRLRARRVGRLLRVLDDDQAEWMRNGGGGDAA